MTDSLFSAEGGVAKLHLFHYFTGITTIIQDAVKMVLSTLMAMSPPVFARPNGVRAKQSQEQAQRVLVQASDLNHRISSFIDRKIEGSSRET